MLQFVETEIQFSGDVIHLKKGSNKFKIDGRGKSIEKKLQSSHMLSQTNFFFPRLTSAKELKCLNKEIRKYI